MSDCKIIKCKTECLNWDTDKNDCKFNHNVYQSAFGMLYVISGCEDFEPLEEIDNIDEYLGDYEEDVYGDKIIEPEEDSFEPELELELEEQPTISKKRPTERTNFGERSKRKILESRNKSPRTPMRHPVEKKKIVEEYDPLDDLRNAAKGNPLSELQDFAEQCKEGSITLEQIEADIKSLDGSSIKESEIGPSSEEMNRVRSEANVDQVNAKAKKKAMLAKKKQGGK